MELKYIVTDRKDFAIFTSLSSHVDVSRSLHGRAIGAGFINIGTVIRDGKEELTVYCHGKSLSLGMESRGAFDEEIIINRLINKDI